MEWDCKDRKNGERNWVGLFEEIELQIKDEEHFGGRTGLFVVEQKWKQKRREWNKKNSVEVKYVRIGWRLTSEYVKLMAGPDARTNAHILFGPLFQEQVNGKWGRGALQFSAL